MELRSSLRHRSLGEEGVKGMQLQYGKWYHVGNFYQRYHRGGSASYLDVKGPASCSSNFMDVSTAAQKDRIGRGTGLWRLVHATLSPGAAAKKPGDAVKTGDTFYLQNCFGSGSYLDVCGPCRACANNNKMDVSTSFVRHREGDGSKTSIWQIVRAVFPDQ